MSSSLKLGSSPPPLKREASPSTSPVTTKQRKTTELVEKIAQQEAYFFEVWRENSDLNIERSGDDVWNTKKALKKAKRNLDSANAALHDAQLKQSAAEKAMVAAKAEYDEALKCRAEAEKQHDKFELVEEVHSSMACEQSCEAEIKEYQKKLELAQEELEQAKTSKDVSINDLDSLNIGELDFLIDQFED